jgi:hypothetical protein
MMLPLYLPEFEEDWIYGYRLEQMSHCSDISL